MTTGTLERTIRVLIVEDSQHMQAALRELYACVDNIAVVAALHDEMTATSWVQEHGRDWDIASVDLVLQDGSGFNVLKRLREAHPGGVVVVLSEYASPGIDDHCRKAGADAVFRKGDPAAFADYFHGKVRELGLSS